MPRPTPARQMYGEENLARRIAYERERRTPPLTYAGLAKRMTDFGCPIQPNAIYRIEKGVPPRAIRVDELVALAKVFGLTYDELLLPPEIVGAHLGIRLFREWAAAHRAIEAAEQKEDDVLARIREHLEHYPEGVEAVAEALDEWAESSEFGPNAIAQLLDMLRGSPRNVGARLKVARLAVREWTADVKALEAELGKERG